MANTKVTMQVYEVLKPWTITEKRSPFFGTHDSGTVQFASDEFTEEQMTGWLDDGILELVSEKPIVNDEE